MIVVAAALSSPAMAQSIDIVAPAPGADPAATPDLRPAIEPDIDDETLARALTIDPATFAQQKSVRTFKRAEPNASARWSRAHSPDGSSTLQVKTAIPGMSWDTAIGGELAIAGAPVTHYEVGGPLPGSIKETRGGAAWANIQVPDVGAVDVRVDPSFEQRKFGTGLQRAVPLGRAMSVTLENRLTVTETYASAGAASAPQIWGNERSVKLNLHATGTTIAAAARSATDSTLDHRRFSAEQTIYGPLRVTTSVTDPGQPTVSKSIGAGMKFDW